MRTTFVFVHFPQENYVALSQAFTADVIDFFKKLKQILESAAGQVVFLLSQHTHRSINDVDLSFGSFDGFVHFAALTKFNGLMNNFKEVLRILDVFNGLDGWNDEPFNLFAEETVIQKMGKTFNDFRHQVFADFGLPIDEIPEVNETKSMLIFVHECFFELGIFVNGWSRVIPDQIDKVFLHWKFLQHEVEALNCVIGVHEMPKLRQARIKVFQLQLVLIFVKSKLMS